MRKPLHSSLQSGAAGRSRLLESRAMDRPVASTAKTRTSLAGATPDASSVMTLAAPYAEQLARPDPCDHLIQLYTDEGFLGSIAPRVAESVIDRARHHYERTAPLGSSAP